MVASRSLRRSHEKTSEGRVGSVLARGTGPGCLRGDLPPAAHRISAANYVFTHFIIRVQKQQLTGGCAIQSGWDGDVGGERPHARVTVGGQPHLPQARTC